MKSMALLYPQHLDQRWKHFLGSVMRPWKPTSRTLRSKIVCQSSFSFITNHKFPIQMPDVSQIPEGWSVSLLRRWVPPVFHSLHTAQSAAKALETARNPLDVAFVLSGLGRSQEDPKLQKQLFSHVSLSCGLLLSPPSWVFFPVCSTCCSFA